MLKYRNLSSSEIRMSVMRPWREQSKVESGNTQRSADSDKDHMAIDLSLLEPQSQSISADPDQTNLVQI